MKAMCLQIAGLRISLCLDGEEGFSPPGFDGFWQATEEADLEVRLQVASASQMRSLLRGCTLLLQLPDWAIYANGHKRLCVNPLPVGRDPTHLAVWDHRFESGVVELYSSRPERALLSDLAFPFFSHLYANHEGLFLHASAVEYKSRAWVFVGPSGRGKSFWARTLQERGCIVLDEDRLVLRRIDGQIWAFDTPWRPKERLSFAEGRIVERIFFPQETNPNTIQSAPPATATAFLLRSTFLPIDDPEAVEAILAVAGQTAQQSRCFLLGRMDTRDMIDRLLQIQ